MKPYSTFINTSRGAVIRENEMIEVLRQRPDLWAVLDVTYPEPPPPDSPLYTLPNVLLTPHIAGSMGEECRRQGRYMIEELERYLAGQPLSWAVTKEKRGDHGVRRRLSGDRDQESSPWTPEVSWGRPSDGRQD